MRVLNPYFYALNPDILAYENAWVNYNNNGTRINIITDEIWDSWEKCKKLKIDPYSNEAINTVSKEEMFNRVAKNKNILATVSPFLQTIFEVIKGPGFMVTFCDTDGIILKTICDDELEQKSQIINLVPSANMSESSVGTNSIHLAIMSKKPSSVTGAEHYREIFHSLSSISAPVFDYSGKLMGIISVWGRHEHANPHTIGVVTSSVKSIHNEMQIQNINEQLTENNSQLKAILESVSDGVIYIRDGKITQINEEMLRLLGRKDVGLINQSVESAIITTPEVNKVLHDINHDRINYKITLFGEKQNYNCIVNSRSVYGSNNVEIGQVLIFKQVEEITQLAKKIAKHTAHYTFDSVIGQSHAISQTIDIAKKTAEHDSRIIIEGESGTGKEVFAQAIHNSSERRNHPFVAIDCGAIPRELFESTLFGYEPGAFTGAKKEGATGAFRNADKGTLFLDEIGNMPAEIQVKLLRVLQENVITKVGSSGPEPINVRIIVATNESLKDLVEKGSFREDLYYRLNVVHLKTPPLRDRKEDIPLLVNHYLSSTGVRNKSIEIDPQAMDILQRYDWPGNIRQLYNAIERAGIMTSGTIIRAKDLPLELLNAINDENEPNNEEEQNLFNKELSLNELNKKYVLYMLNKNNRNISKTAEILGVTRVTIYKYINSET